MNTNIEADAYEAFRRNYGNRTTQAAIARLVRWFNAMPPDAREVILSDLSPESQVIVLRAVIRDLQRRAR